MNKENITISQNNFKCFSLHVQDYRLSLLYLKKNKSKLHQEMVAKYLKCWTWKTDESTGYPNLIYVT